MSRTTNFRKSLTATVVANGTARVDFSPTSTGEVWDVRSVRTQLSVVPTTGTPQFLAYVDGVFVGGSVTPDMDTDSAFNEEVPEQSHLIGVWSGCVAGSIATMTISGKRTVAA